MTQGIRIDQPIVDPKTGMPTDYFLRLIQGNNGVLDTTGQTVEDLLARQIIAGAGLAGGGTLETDVTLNVGTASTARIVVNADNVDLAETAVTAGSYTNTDLTVDAYGRITAAANGAGGGSFRGALVTKAANQTAANYSGGAVVAWDSEAYDTDTIHDNVTNNSRLSVPSGVTYVRLSGQLLLDNVAAGSDIYVEIRKNNTNTFTGYTQVTADMPSITAPSINLSTPVLAVTGGTDYFEVKLTCADASITVYATWSWFAMEIIA